MDNPVDHPIDLGFVNYVQHPENKDYIVFRFTDEQRANAFENELNAQSVWFERDSELKREKVVHMFGIHKTDFNKVQQMNFRVEAVHKKPVIPWAGLRYGLLAFFFLAIILASIGYCKRQETIRSIDEASTSLNRVDWVEMNSLHSKA